MKLHCLQHSKGEEAFNLAKWAEEKKHPLTVCKLYEEEKLPALSEFDGLVLLGGTMGTRDEPTYPWLKAEKTLVTEAIAGGKKVLGICLGSQILAEQLGARVYKAPFKEIGWFTLNLTEQAKQLPLFKGLPTEFFSFQWHGDTFDLPNEAVPLVRGNVVANQGFLYRDHVLALQFHPEISWEGIAAWIKASPEEMAEATTQPYIQRPYQMLANPEKVTEQEKWMVTVLNRFFKG